MAERRMFSKRIVNSARFSKLPISSQALYFHLGLHADDDGIVEAYNVIKTVGCSEDDLKILVLKGFVKILNEDLVSYITDWAENNRIRADRKIDSIYKDLLISIIPDIELVEPRERADVKKRRTEAEKKLLDVQWTTNGQPMDGIGKDSIGKDRLGKDSLVKDNIYTSETEAIITYLNQKTDSRYKVSTSKTQSLIKARLKEGYTVKDFYTVIDKKCTDWKGTEYEKFLRPETLFGNKFEGYLNQKIRNNKQDVFGQVLEGSVTIHDTTGNGNDSEDAEGLLSLPF
jgi:uncharacterized phage protein (TIGR02220 family)